MKPTGLAVPRKAGADLLLRVPGVTQLLEEAGVPPESFRLCLQRALVTLQPDLAKVSPTLCAARQPFPY